MMLPLVLIATTLAVAFLPRVLPLERAAPMAAATAWLSALGARGLALISLALASAFYLPAPLVELVRHWCVSIPLPGTGIAVVVTGHLLTQIIVLVPACALAASTAQALWVTVRDARRVRTLLRDHVLWIGPGNAAVVAGDNIVVAAAGVTRPRLVVSAGALVALDDDELAAGLDHERGHISHGHRYLVVLAELLHGVSRFLPGAGHAKAEAMFHLERDADQWSLRRDHDPAVLARAICKAALTPASTPAMTGLASGRTVRRVEMLLRTETGLGPRRALVTAVAVGVSFLSLLSLSAVPATAAGGVHVLQDHQPEQHCVT
jgi:hypothetical protein